MSKSVLVNEIIHPPHRCVISRSWLDSMIIAQVCLRLATIKGPSKMFSFITEHNATDVVSFEGACNWHADCRNLHQSCCLWIECSFLYHKPSPNVFQRIWQYIQPASQPQTTCNHTSPGPWKAAFQVCSKHPRWRQECLVSAMVRLVVSRAFI